MIEGMRKEIRRATRLAGGSIRTAPSWRFRSSIPRGSEWFLCALLAAPLSAQQLPELKHKPAAPEQPLPFSHKKHAALGLECVGCHAMPPPGDYAEIAGSDLCMSCHVSIKADSPAIRKLSRFHEEGEEIPWQPVYLIADYVFFSHAVHVKQVGARCGDCHGPVGERDALAKERDVSMTACMSCHRAKKGSLECDYCHDPR